MGIISEASWNKIYKKELFNDLVFPEGQLYEDTATTYKIINKGAKISYLRKALYNRVVRKESITHDHSKKNTDNFLFQITTKYQEIINNYREIDKQYPIQYFFNNLLYYCRLISIFEQRNELYMVRDQLNELYRNQNIKVDKIQKLTLSILNHSIADFCRINQLLN